MNDKNQRKSDIAKVKLKSRKLLINYKLILRNQTQNIIKIDLIN